MSPPSVFGYETIAIYKYTFFLQKEEKFLSFLYIFAFFLRFLGGRGDNLMPILPRRRQLLILFPP
jgi:hypothetical protein